MDIGSQDFLHIVRLRLDCAAEAKLNQAGSVPMIPARTYFSEAKGSKMLKHHSNTCKTQNTNIQV